MELRIIEITKEKEKIYSKLDLQIARIWNKKIDALKNK